MVSVIFSTQCPAHPDDVQISLNLMASSGGRSTTINPFAPAAAASETAFSSP